MSKRRSHPDAEFVLFILDQLGSMPAIACRRMFGGHGFYSGSVFFAIAYQGRFYIKTDDVLRDQLVELGMEPFRPTPKMTLKTYYEVPADILENGESLRQWVARSIAAAAAAENE